MGSLHYSFLVLLAILVSSANAQKGLHLPVRKDPKTLQHYTTFQMGSNRTNINTVIDLGAEILWFGCDNYTSNSYSPIACDSSKCELAKGLGCIVECHRSDPRPGCTNNTCGSTNFNPFEEFLSGEGYYEDTLYAKENVQVPQFIFSCSSNDYLKGLASGTIGMLGLARTQISLHKQVTGKLNLPDKFSICLPSSGLGKLSIGDVSSSSKPDISPLLKSTPLIINPNSTSPVHAVGDAAVEYFIGVKSIRVNGETLSIKDSYFTFDKDGNGGTKISTIQNYTSLHTSIYKPLTRAFVKAASDMKIKSVAAVAPFRACFSSSSISKTAAGPAVPPIDLVLPGTDVYWRINGANSIVEIDQKTSCLGFVEAAPRPKPATAWPTTSIVIGTHQLEENLLVFDLVSSQLQFSSSLLAHGKSCSRV
ncbi:probable aspartic proteinase GIP2 [Primulina eburnea]|uniref:probable aspartic proteinase GIP2 n=1 Tax=Primulina eburnea TaxID=1245227 RepID=UPI003C6CB3AA